MHYTKGEGDEIRLSQEALKRPEIGQDELFCYSALALAHMGDAVYEVLVRGELCGRHMLTNQALHKKTVELVCAKSQAEAARRIWEELDEEERGVFMRGRNTRLSHIPKAATAADYGQATALEAVFGYLYLQGRNERINELFEICRSTFGQREK